MDSQEPFDDRPTRKQQQLAYIVYTVGVAEMLVLLSLVVSSTW